ncbi:hypothetical protein N7495_007316 [Penicillium taxi]|uniref:uncharacterized protein n=1 Tax=Penicillium taxi TaxID=168475 RepID=UPI002545A637|nr:uncharacterized protein N7495_007316 [Penicillium taxi]KAJ5895625.1 hypothetical protein N7495_007316 [Penicillium taxi]
MPITRRISMTNFVVACTALCFQVGVLYPWHHQLDEEFKQLKVDHLRLLKENEESRMSELRSITEHLKLRDFARQS